MAWDRTHSYRYYLLPKSAVIMKESLTRCYQLDPIKVILFLFLWFHYFIVVRDISKGVLSRVLKEAMVRISYFIKAEYNHVEVI